MLRSALTIGAVAFVAVALLVSRTPREAEAATLFVFNPADSGFGTFRWAVEQANSNSSIDRIVLKNTIPITLDDSVEYTGSQALTVQGDHPLLYRIIQGASGSMGTEEPGPEEPTDCGLFESLNGADITFTQVVVQDSWCDGINVRGISGAGEVVVTLNKTILRNNAFSGVFVHEEDGSNASLKLVVTASFIEDNGACDGPSPAEPVSCAYGGAEVQEDEAGTVIVSFSGTSVTGNGGDGVNIDSRGSGNVSFTATNSKFNGNGGNVDVDASGSGDDEVSAASHAEGDGVLIFKYDAGSTSITLNNVQLNGNSDDGFDITTGDGAGDVSLTATTVVANSNGEDGIDVNEDENGKVIVKLTGVQAWYNDADGFAIEEIGGQNLDVQASGSSANFNGDDGFDLYEEGNGNFVAKLTSSVANANDSDGIQAESSDGGSFALQIFTSTVTGNGDDALDLTVTGTPGTVAFGTSTVVGGIDLTNVVVVP